LRVLQKNFPNSSFLGQGFAATTKPWWQLW
jgi:hypothetical protein